MSRRKLRAAGKGWPRTPLPPDPETIRLRLRSREVPTPGPRVNL